MNKAEHAGNNSEEVLFMSELSTFVDAVYDCYDKIVPEVEEGQELPPKDVLEEVCQILLNVSCMREEGRFPSFRVCFIRPDAELLDTYIYAHVLLFREPVNFSPRDLNKLAPALSPVMSYLILDISQRPFRALGVIAAYTAWEKIVTRELSSGNRMPRVPNILVSGPGELRACFGETSMINYNAGRCIFFRTDIFTSTLVSEKLENGTSIPENDRLRLLYRILWKVSNYGHGAAILIAPSAESCKGFIDLKYQLDSGFLFDDGSRPEPLSAKAKEKEITTYADLIARLTNVDGSVVLTKDLELLGFGAEILVDEMKSRLPEMCFIGYDNKEQTYKTFKDHGMRHRAGYRFCDAVEGSVAFIISQDGMVEACTKNDGKVYVYDNVALPLL